MTTYVIDANLVFSEAMNPISEIGQFIMLAKLKNIKLIAPEYLNSEIAGHLPKLIKLSKLSESEIHRVIELAYEKIDFVKDADIPLAYWVRGADLVKEVDEDDIVYLALNELLQVELWTGDMTLFRHLVGIGYTPVLTFLEIKERHL